MVADSQDHHLGQWADYMLQWSRDTLVTDLVCLVAVLMRVARALIRPRLSGRGFGAGGWEEVVIRGHASMRPRRVGRGFGLRTKAERRKRSSFNGAATIRSRKFNVLLQQSAVVFGLQWSRDPTIAEIAPCGTSVVSISGLQWSRDQTIAEMRKPG